MTKSQNTLKANLAEIRRVLTLLPEQGQVVELHIPNTDCGMHGGYYSVPGVYITLVVATQTTA